MGAASETPTTKEYELSIPALASLYQHLQPTVQGQGLTRGEVGSILSLLDQIEGMLPDQEGAVGFTYKQLAAMPSAILTLLPSEYTRIRAIYQDTEHKWGGDHMLLRAVYELINLFV